MIDTNEMKSLAYNKLRDPIEIIFALCDEIDRLRGEKQPPQGKTVKVKVAVGVEPTGKWNAFGWAGGTDAEKMELTVEPLDTGEARFWLTADLPLPEEMTVEAEVERE